MKREVVLDTETTGLRPDDGHCLVEIAALELVNHVPTGRQFHAYINPERDVPEEAVRVHGLTARFLKDFSVFGEIYQDFLGFIKNDPLIIHNAPFDMGFLNYFLKKQGAPVLENEVIDTLQMARKKFPGSPASLDALCRRFKVDLSARDKHGALIDCELLAAVYLELIGGRQQGLILELDEANAVGGSSSMSSTRDLVQHYQKQEIVEARQFPIRDSEKKAHQDFIKNKILKN